MFIIDDWTRAHLYEQDDGWYFADETGDLRGNGPYRSVGEARHRLNLYCEYSLTRYEDRFTT